MRKHIFYILTFILISINLSHAQTFVFKGKVTWVDLVVNLKNDRSKINNSSDLNSKMAENSKVVFENAHVVLRSKKEESLFLMMDELILNNTIIETNGNLVTLICKKITSSNSSIVSFLNKESNSHGKNGGDVRLIVLDTLHGKLNVFLEGQNGANGQNEKTNYSRIEKKYIKTEKVPVTNPDNYYDTGSIIQKPRTTTVNKVVTKKETVEEKILATNGYNGGNGGNLFFYSERISITNINSFINFSSFAGKGGNAGNNSLADGLSGKPGFMKIEKYNFEDFFGL